MKSAYKSFLSLLLVLCMLLQPFAPVIAAESASEAGVDAAAAKAEFEDVYAQVKDLKPVELDTVMEKCVGATSGIKNIRTYFHNGLDNAFNGGKNQKEYVDYINQIKDANKQIEDAKSQMESIKAQFDAGNIDAAIAADPTAIAQGGLAAQSKAMSTLRNTLNEAGTALQKVGDLLDNLSKILTGISFLLKGIAFVFAPAAPAILTVTSIMDPVAGVCGHAGPLIKEAGNALVATAESAQCTDDILIGNLTTKVGGEAAKQVVSFGLSKGSEKLIGDIAGYLDPADADNLAGDIGKFWDPKGAAANGLSTMLQDKNGITDQFTEDFYEKMAGQGIDTLNTLTGEKIKGYGDLTEDLIDYGIDKHTEGVMEKKSAASQPGLNFGGAGHSF